MRQCDCRTIAPCVSTVHRCAQQSSSLSRRDYSTAVSYVGRGQGTRFVAFFACLHYAMLCPDEAAGRTDAGSELPGKGCGLLHVEETRSAVGRDYNTDEVHDERGLKQRSRKAARPIPIPPELVGLLRQHIATCGVGPDKRIFRSVNGKPIRPSTYSTVWRKAREYGLAPKDRRSLVLIRPYDLCHADVTARLFAGIPDPRSPSGPATASTS